MLTTKNNHMKKILLTIILTNLISLSVGWFMGEKYDLRNPITKKDEIINIDKEPEDIEDISIYFPQE